MKGIIFAILFFACITEASEIKRQYRSTRQLGEGDTGAAFAEGLDAVFYNPANLESTYETKTSMTEISILSPQLTVSKDLRSIVQNVSSEMSNLQSKPLDEAMTLENKDLHAELYDVNGVATHGFAIGLYQMANIDFQVQEAKAQSLADLSFLPSIVSSSYIHAGLVFGLARLISSNNFSVGANLKVLQKDELNINLSGSSLLNSQTSGKSLNLSSLIDKRGGLGVGSDIGINYHWDLSGTTRFIVGTVVQNLGYMSYPWAIVTEEPHPDKQSINLGLGLHYVLGNHNFRFAFDFQDLLDSTKEVIYKRLHLGSEWNFLNTIGVATGINQGYTTYGFFFQWKPLKLAYSTYGEEIGTQPGSSYSGRDTLQLQVGWIL